MRFLIDECLHTSLVGVANDAGHEAHHVAYRGWAGLEDYELRPIILREEFLFVTNNGRDFLELLSAAELHPGLVIIVPNEKPPVQQALFRAALATITSLPSTLNRIIEVHSSKDFASTICRSSNDASECPKLCLVSRFDGRPGRCSRIDW